MELLTNNHNCQLPCWWGIVPGQTSWRTARQFLDTFAISIKQGSYGYIPINGRMAYVTNYSVDYEISGRQESGITLYSTLDNIVSDIQVEVGGGGGIRYQLNQFLTDLGKPTEVRIFTSINIMAQPPPFYLIVFYADKGVMAQYEYEAKRVNESLIGCPIPVDPELWLWPPADNLTIEALQPLGPPDPIFVPKSLTEATAWTIDTFYEEFKRPDSKTCLETPLSIWP
jgi:hypothetical protein